MNMPKLTMKLVELPEWIERTIQDIENPTFDYSPADIANALRNMLEVLAATPQSAPVDGETRPIYWMGEEVKTTARLIEIVKEQCSAAIDYVLADDTTPPPASQERGGEYLNFVLHRLHELEDDAQGEVDKYRQSDDADSRSCGYWTGKVSAFGEIAELLEASPPSSAEEVLMTAREIREANAAGARIELITEAEEQRRAAEQAKLVAINPVEIDSKLIPDADAEQARTGEFREWFRKNAPGGTVISDPDWWSGPGFGGVRQADDGDFVLYCDYDQLRNRLAEIEVECREAWKQAAYWRPRAEQAEAKLALAEQLLRECVEKREGLAYEDGLLRRIDAAIGAIGETT